ncbi:MAG: S1C family serine protease [Sporichthyaceae bacterium]
MNETNSSNSPFGADHSTGPSPAPQHPTASRRSIAMLAVVALSAGLLGGGIGALAVGDASDAPASTSTSTAATSPVIKPVSAAPADTAQAVAAKVAPSVVSIDVRNVSPQGGFFGGPAANRVEGSGSGVVIGEDGLILTNNHVAGAGDLTVTFADGRAFPATLVKADPVTDLAVIKAEGIDDARPIAFGKSSELVVGQNVYAMGSPLGLSGTFTAGIVSALHRPVVPQAQAGSAHQSVIDAIQTDAPINPGNSGGALVDGAGNLVGITSAIAALGDGSGSIGLGFAIPIDQAKVVAEKLARGETVAHGQLGVQVGDAVGETVRGAALQAIVPGGAADKAGLRAGDVVTGFDGRPIGAADALLAGVRSEQPGTTHELTYVRGGQTKKTTVTLGSDATRTDS